MKRIIAAIILALLLLPAAASTASAAGIEVVDRTGDGTWIGDTWEVNIYPGETKVTALTLYNSSSSSLDVEVTILPDSLDNGNLTFELDKPSFTMRGGTYTDVTLTVKANGSATPRTYTAELGINPEVATAGGGGEGGITRYLRVDLWGEKSKTRVTSAGRVRADLEAISVDEMLTVYITKGVLAQTEDGRRLREIEVWPMAQPPPLPENGYIIGVAYDFSPDGATFDAPIEFLINYDPEELPENVSSLFIASYDEEQGWRQLAPISGFVAAVGTATAEVSHFTTFAVIATVKPPVPAAFTVSKLIISPTEVDIGQSVTSSVIVANTGGETGSYKVTFKIGGVLEATKEVTISAGASEKVTFTTAKDVAGSYSIDVNGLSGSFTVKEKPAPPPTPAPTPPSMPVIPFNWPLVGGIIAGVVLTGLGVFFWIRRRA